MATVDRVLDDAAAEVLEVESEIAVEAHSLGLDAHIDIDWSSTRRPRRGWRGLVVIQFFRARHHLAFGFSIARGSGPFSGTIGIGGGSIGGQVDPAQADAVRQRQLQRLGGGLNENYGRELLETQAQLMELKPGWAETLKQYDVRVVLVPPDNALASALQLSSDWKRMYTDSVAVVFQRTS